MSFSRRHALVHMGLGTACLFLGSRPGLSGIKLGPEAVKDLVAQIRKRPHEQIFDLAAEQMRKGLDYKTLLAAVFLAGVEDISPWQVGGKLHSVFVVASIYDLTDSASAEEAWLGALWNLDDFKRSQTRDRMNGDWVLPAKNQSSFSSETFARTEYLSALDGWASERADRALVGLLPFHSQDSFFEILWPYGARCFDNLGHKMIYAAQVHRTLKRMGWQHAEPVLRSLTMSLVSGAPGVTEDWQRARILSSSFPAEWVEGKHDPKASVKLLAQLRTANSEDAQQLVISGLKQGYGPQTLWDGLRLFAAELFMRHPKVTAMNVGDIILPVHAVTVNNAFGYMFRNTRSEETRRIMLLQAAAFLANIRTNLIKRIQFSMQGPGVDQLGSDVVGESSLEEGFARYSAGTTCAALDRNPKLLPEFRKQLRHALMCKGVEHHQHKYLAAAWEESLLVDPRWQSRLLASAVTYLNANEPDTELLERSRLILKGRAL